jgi:hypothetical protein
MKRITDQAFRYTERSMIRLAFVALALAISPGPVDAKKGRKRAAAAGAVILGGGSDGNAETSFVGHVDRVISGNTVVVSGRTIRLAIECPPGATGVARAIVADTTRAAEVWPSGHVNLTERTSGHFFSLGSALVTYGGCKPGH